MADDKNINIAIATTADMSGTTAAKAAIDGLIVVEKSAGEVSSSYMTALEAEAAEIERLAQAARKAEPALENLNQGQRKVTTSGGAMRYQMSNIGYQIQDFAVQTQMGTSAMRAFSQQAPQLLGSFGPIGIALGTVAALAPAIMTFFSGSAAGAKEAAESVAALKTVTEDYAEAAKKAADAKDISKLEKWYEALDAEEEGINRINKALEESVKLEIKLRTLKSGVDAAKRDLAIANIESDPKLSEGDKIRQVAEYKEKDEREKAAAKIASLTDAAKGAGKTQDAAAKTANRQEADLEEVTRKRDELVATQKANEEAAKNAAQTIPGLQEKISGRQDSLAYLTNPETGATLPEYEKTQNEIDDLKSQLAEAKTKSGAFLTGGQLSDTQKQDAALVAKAEAAVTVQQKQADDAQKAFRDANSDRLVKEAAARYEAPLITEQYQVESQARKVRTNTRATAADDKESDRQNKNAESDRNRDKKKAESRTSAEAGIGKSALGLLPNKGVKDEFRKAVQKAALALQDGAQGEEMKELVKLMNQLAGAAMVKGTKTQVDLKNLGERIRKLEGK